MNSVSVYVHRLTTRVLKELNILISADYLLRPYLSHFLLGYMKPCMLLIPTLTFAE